MIERDYRLAADLKMLERDLAGHVHVARESWSFANQWASSLTDAQLRQCARLKIPGDAGMASEQEARRRGLR